MKHISPTFVYIIPMYLRLKTFTKTLPQMSFHLKKLLFSLWGSTHDSADCWSTHKPHICPRLLQTCARLIQGWMASARWPPPTKILAGPVCSGSEAVGSAAFYFSVVPMPSQIICLRKYLTCSCRSSQQKWPKMLLCVQRVSHVKTLFCDFLSDSECDANSAMTLVTTLTFTAEVFR